MKLYKVVILKETVANVGFLYGCSVGMVVCVCVSSYLDMSDTVYSSLLSAWFPSPRYPLNNTLAIYVYTVQYK